MAMDRAVLVNGFPGISRGGNAKWRIVDVLLVLMLIILNIPVYYFEPFQRQFTINDITISHPYAEHQTVNDAMLFVYSLVIPLITIVSVWALFADAHHKWFLLYTSVLGLFLSVSADALITNFIKNWVGRLRPDFLARCQPQAGLPLDTLLYAKDACTTKDLERLLEGFRTTPSGHSSESFSGLGYLYLWLCGQLLTEHPRSSLATKAIAFVPLVGASMIAFSRTQDYRHHFVDVVTGSLLGYFFAYFSYHRFFPSITDPMAFRPLLDDSEVKLNDNDHHILPQDEEMEPIAVRSIS